MKKFFRFFGAILTVCVVVILFAPLNAFSGDEYLTKWPGVT